MRSLASLLTLMTGLILAPLSYFVLGGFHSPRVPFAAGLFIVAVMLVFISAVVYELIPDREMREQG